MCSFRRMSWLSKNGIICFIVFPEKLSLCAYGNNNIYCDGANKKAFQNNFFEDHLNKLLKTSFDVSILLMYGKK